MNRLFPVPALGLPVLVTVLSFFGLAGCSSPGVGGPGTTGETEDRLPEVVIRTPLGVITAEVDLRRAPVTAGQFLANVEAGVFDGRRASFYRVVRADNQPVNPVKIAVIQGGVDRETGDLATPYIPHETTVVTGLRHRDGTLSMAREDPGTANTEFFICIGDQPELDHGGRRNPDGEGFAAFGQVVFGMEVVRAIQRLPDEGQYLVDPLPIHGIDRVR